MLGLVLLGLSLLLLTDLVVWVCADRSFAESSWSALQAHFAQGHPWTLCHGDFHAANMLLVTEGQQQQTGGGEEGQKGRRHIVMVDWSEVRHRLQPHKPCTSPKRTDPSHSHIADVDCVLCMPCT